MSQGFFQCAWNYLARPLNKTSDEFADEIKYEIAFHISQRASDLEASGLTPSAAHTEALTRFGDVARYASECHRESTSGIGWFHRLHLVTTLVMGVVVCFLLINQFGRNAISVAKMPPGILAMLDNDWSGTVNGRVESEDGDPIHEAKLLVTVKTWPDGSYCQRGYSAVTDSNGRFSIAGVCPLNAHYEVQVTAIAPDHELKSSYKEFDKGESKPFDFQLGASSGVTLVVEDSSGSPLPNVQILPHERIDRQGNTHSLYFDSGQPMIATTDQQGRVNLPYFRAGDQFTVLVHSKGDWLPLETIAPATGEFASVHAPRISQPH